MEQIRPSRLLDYEKVNFPERWRRLFVDRCLERRARRLVVPSLTSVVQSWSMGR